MKLPKLTRAHGVALSAAALLAAAPAFGAGIGLKEVASGFTSPMALAALTDGSGHMLISDQIGTISVLDKSGKMRGDLFADLRPKMAKLRDGKFDERGLLGLALHPNFKENRKFYVCYSAPLRKGGPKGWDHTGHVSEFTTKKDNPLKADLSSERVILQIDQPSFNHDGGRIAFGPDGHLYIGVGDGGNKNDEGIGHPEMGNGQNLDTLLGKILRIDVNKKSDGKQYAVPSDNPFVGKKGRDEIYAYGLRNPWGISFDMSGDQHLFVADVGQNMFEEVNIVKNGGNYGWKLREGRHGFDPKNPVKLPETAATKGANGEPLIDPIIEYRNFKGHQGNRYAKEIRGVSVTGGYVYRGSVLPELDGQYIFADWSKNWGFADGYVLAANKTKAGDSWNLRELRLTELPGGRRLGAYVTALGQDNDGEVYVMTNSSNSLRGKTGKVFKLVRVK